MPFGFAGRLAFCAELNCAPQELCERILARASCLPESSGRALVADAREDSPVSDALLSIPEKRDAHFESVALFHPKRSTTVSPASRGARIKPLSSESGEATCNRSSEVLRLFHPSGGSFGLFPLNVSEMLGPYVADNP
jgi:hypothetical protein